jgi:flagellar motor switch protein FliN
MSSSSNSLSSNAASGTAGHAAGQAAALVPLSDVVCQIDVLLGTATVSVRDCLHWKRNSVIRLRQSAGSDMQVTINGVPVAIGEVVIVDDSTAVRVTEILAPPSTESAS